MNSRLRDAVRAGCADPWPASVLWKSSPSPPAAPDPYEVARAQGAANVETARVQGRMNNPNINTPLGQQTVTWGNGPATFDEDGYNKALEAWKASGPIVDQPGGTTGPGEPTSPAPDRNTFMKPGENDQATINQTLTPEGQARFDQEQRIVTQLGGVAERGLGRVDEAMSKPFDMSRYPDMVTQIGDYATDRNKVEEALMSRINPQLERDEAALRQRLANQGLTANHEAYGNDMDAFGRERNDARMQAILGAGQEQTRLFNQGLASAGFTNNARQQGIQEQSFQRNLPLNEINALRSGSQVTMPQFQQFQGAGGIAPPPIASQVNNAYGQQLGAYNTQVGQANSFNSGLMSLGGAGLMMFSDARLKSNVERIGTHPLGIGVYAYDIFDRREIGVMAHEVESVKPDAVITHESGYKMVNYGAL